MLLRTWLPYDWTPRSDAYFVFPLAQGTPGKQCGLAATGVYQPSLRSPWLAAKVEAGVKYVKHNALAGEVFDDWNHLEAYLMDWLETVANVRQHGTTGETPRARFERDERSTLKPYLTPASLGVQTPVERRKVDKTGLISWYPTRNDFPMIAPNFGINLEQS